MPRTRRLARRLTAGVRPEAWSSKGLSRGSLGCGSSRSHGSLSHGSLVWYSTLGFPHALECPRSRSPAGLLPSARLQSRAQAGQHLGQAFEPAAG